MITNNSVKVKCSFCEKEFFRRKGRFNEAKKFNWKQYCSWKCLSRDKLKRQILFCENCGKRFERTQCGISPHNYCSQSCAAIVNNKKYQERKTGIKICIRCGGRFKKSSRNLKYCSIRCLREAKGYTSEKLINIIKQITQKLGRVPGRREAERITKPCVKIFGSWNKAVSTAGFEPNRSHDNRMYKRVNAKSLDGHLCDSVSELLIDNWLFKNGISHERDVQYPRTFHKADWKISVNNKEIFVEYFGLANDSPRYDRSIRQKESLCKSDNIFLIGIYPKDIYPQNNLENNLKNKFREFLSL